MEWMKGNKEAGLRGKQLLRNILFGVIGEEYLKMDVRELLPDEHGDWIESLVEAAMVAQASVRAKAAAVLHKLSAKALTPRTGTGVDWGRYEEGAEGCRLDSDSGQRSGLVCALKECQGHICSGYEDGSIGVWSMETLEQERTLQGGRSSATGNALAAWEGQLISGYGDGKIQVLDFAMWRPVRELLHVGARRPRQQRAHAVSVCGSRLASGSNDSMIKVWTIGPESEWPCERALAGHSWGVNALARWVRKLVSGAGDCTVRVWDLGTGALEATLIGHSKAVVGLLVHGERFFSASADQTIRVLAAGTWAAVASVEAYGPFSLRAGRGWSAGPTSGWGSGGCSTRCKCGT